MLNKAAFLLGEFNSNALHYGTHEVVKNCFNLAFQNVFLPYIQIPTRLLEQVPLQLTISQLIAS